MSKIERKYMAHYLDTKFSYDPRDQSSSLFDPSWYRIGEDLEEYSVEMNPRIEIERNVFGDDIVVSDGYEMSGEAERFYADKNDALFIALQEIIDNLYEDEKCYTYALEVHLFAEVYSNSVVSGNSGSIVSDGGIGTPTFLGYEALMRPCYVSPISYGGDTSGYQIPFGVVYLNNFATSGTFLPNGRGSGTFTPYE